MKLIWRPLDLILVLLLLASIAFTVLRGLVRTTANWKKKKNLGKWGCNNLCLSRSSLHFILDMLMIPTNHIPDELDKMLSCPPCTGSSGLSSGRLLHLCSALRALPERPCWLPPCHGDRCISLLVSDCQCSQHLITARWSVFKQPASRWNTACCKLNPTALFSRSLVDWKAIFHYYRNEQRSDPPFVSPLVWYQTTMWAEVIWSPSFSCSLPDMAASPSWLFILGACCVRFAQRTQPLSIGYPKTLLGPQSGRICESLIRQASRMVRTW